MEILSYIGIDKLVGEILKLLINKLIGEIINF